MNVNAASSCGTAQKVSASAVVTAGLQLCITVRNAPRAATGALKTLLQYAAMAPLGVMAGLSTTPMLRTPRGSTSDPGKTQRISLSTNAIEAAGPVLRSPQPTIL